MLLPLNKIKKTKNKNYIKYSFNVTKVENIKIKIKIFVKHQANRMSIFESNCYSKH